MRAQQRSRRTRRSARGPCRPRSRHPGRSCDQYLRSTTVAVTADKATSPLAGAEKARPATELVVAWVFGPLSRLLVPALLRPRVPPAAVVLVHAEIGLAGAALRGAAQHR